MRKVLGLLLGGVLVGAFFIPSCSSKDSGEGGGSGGTSGVGGAEPQLGTGGGAGSSGGGTSDSGTSTQDACPKLKIVSGDGKTCGSSTVAAQYRDINMLIVLDKSKSMDLLPSSSWTKTKWDATQEALGAALADSTSKVRYGLLMYPYSETVSKLTCELPTASAAVNVNCAEGTADTIVDTLKSTSPGGGTPTAAALRAAYEYFVSGPGQTLTGAKYVMLATDGGPNCNAEGKCDIDACTVNLDNECPGGDEGTNCCDPEVTSKGPLGCVDDAAVLAEIEALAAKRIKTFVVGIPGTEDYASYLTEFAKAGRQVNPADKETAYYAVSADAGVAGLTDTFKRITEQLVKDCAVKLTDPVSNRAMLNVAVECQLLPQGKEGARNWEYSETEDGEPIITILGDTCERIETTGVERVDVIEGCTTIDIL